MKKTKIFTFSQLKDREPTYALVANVDLVIIKYDKNVSVLYGRCLHRGALLADGSISGNNLLCGVHFWDYQYDSGISAYNNEEKLKKFSSWIDVENDAVYVDENEISEWELENPQPYNRESYLGKYADIHGTPEEPHNSYIQKLAKQGIKGIGKHGPSSSMGVPSIDLPSWNDIQILTAQLSLANHCWTMMMFRPD